MCNFLFVLPMLNDVFPNIVPIVALKQLLISILALIEGNTNKRWPPLPKIAILRLVLTSDVGM